MPQAEDSDTSFLGRVQKCTQATGCQELTLLWAGLSWSRASFCSLWRSISGDFLAGQNRW